MIESLKPIIDYNSNILLLGTMPGMKSLAIQEYYAHGGNQFWRILFQIFNKEFTKDYQERKNLLINNHIALWDVLNKCEREGSADSKITKEIPNDFETLFNNYTKISHIFFTSKVAEKYYNKYINHKENLIYKVLSSPSNQNNWKTYEEKVKDWSQILSILKA